MTNSEIVRVCAESGKNVRSLYVHIPFCYHKCHYCDFYSIVDDSRHEVFVSRLVRELEAISEAASAGLMETVFFGGGTPTLLSPELWRPILRTLRERFGIGDSGATDAEFTVECNPETASPELFALLKSGGVNRVSFGAQSFDPRHLKTLERWHDPESVARAVELARAAGISRINIDLIACVPGQTLEEHVRDIENALSLGVRHVSCYTLTYEPNTAMTVRLRRGEFQKASEDAELEMMAATREVLANAGLDRYEVSNFAQPGEECAHNMVYWRCGDWLAAGPSAAGHVGGWRWKNMPRLGDYLACDDRGFAPAIELEPPDPARLVREKIMLGLRLREGLDESALLRDAEAALADSAENLRRDMVRFASEGLLTCDSGRVRLTDAGVLLCDAVASELMACVLGP